MTLTEGNVAQVWGISGAVVLARRPGQNAWMGLVEEALSMDWSQDCVRFWPTGIFRFDAASTITLDGRGDAAWHVAHLQSVQPEWQIEAYSVEEPTFPIVIDWAAWREATDKFARRNPAFQMRE